MPDAGFGPVALGLQVVGMFSSAVGAYGAAQAQKQALSAQAQLEKLNARSTAMAMNGQADLDLVNQKMGFESMTFGNSMNMLGTEKNIFDAKSGASLNMLQATTQASLTLSNASSRAAIGELQTGMQVEALNVGAHVAEQNADLLELQAQSTMLHGEWREQDSRMQYAQAKSRATVQMARGNVDLSEGTPLAQRVGIDLMSERAAIMIQQDTLTQAFGQRVQASNSLLDAGLKRAQAQSVSAINKIQTLNDTQTAETQAASVLQQATLKSALTDMNAEFDMHMAQSQTDWTNAMVKAGMAQAEAAVNYKHTMADAVEKNALASSNVKTAMASGISPGAAALGSLLGNAGQVASSWYMMSKSTKG